MIIKKPDKRLENPLLPHVMKALQEIDLPCTEHKLLKLLTVRGYFAGLDDEDENLYLFQRHFLLMNALYQLREDFAESGWCLRISALDIHLLPLSQGDQTNLQALNDEQALADYYLDLSQLKSATREGVESLLGGFWQAYARYDNRAEALQVLGLDALAETVDIKNAYRRLAAANHPDRGGEPARFIEIRRAYELLC